MAQPKAVRLDNAFIDIGRHRATILPKDFSNATKDPEGTITWDPGVSGILLGESRQSESSDHGGERHLDGDEVLYVISGSIRLSLETSEETRTEIAAQPGEVIVVPRGVWHQLIVNEPSRYLHLGGGRTEIRPAAQAKKREQD